MKYCDNRTIVFSLEKKSVAHIGQERQRQREERERERGRQTGREREREIKVFKSDTLIPYTSSLKYMNVTLESKVVVLKSRQLSCYSRGLHV